ncbi:MAG: metal-dependent hydrolase [Nanoarchaeota archaeon]
MLGTTHLLFAILFGSIYIKYVGAPESLFLQIFFAATLMLGAMLPDLDSKHSTISKQHPTTSKIIRIFSGHRGIMHSVFIPVGIFLIANYMLPELFGLPPELFVGFLIGYISHLASDIITIGGLELFHPFSSYRIRGFIRTGGKLEMIIASLIVVYLLIF